MNEPSFYESTDQIALVRVDDERPRQEGWAGWLVVYSRAAAAISLAKGLYHWAAICGFISIAGGPFDAQSASWQIATVFFAVFDMVAAVGLWINAAWGAIIWLASSVTMIVVQGFLPQIFGVQPFVIAGEVALISGYGYIAIQSAREPAP